MFSQVLQITAPVFGIAFIGFLYGRFTGNTMDAANNANMSLFVPAMLFYILTEKIPSLGAIDDIAIAVVMIIFASAIISGIIARIAGIPSRAFVPTMMFNNAGNLGLPLAALAFGEDLLPLSVIIFVVSATLHHSIGVWYISKRLNPIEQLKNPVLLATCAGILCNLYDIHTPQALLPGLEMLSKVAVPLLLVSLGVRLNHIDMSHWKLGLFAAILKPVMGVALAWLTIRILDLDQDHARVILLYGALPPAVVSFLFAEKYNQYPHQNASIVAMGNLMALISIPLILAVIL